MIFVLDNYDSFTYNLVQGFGELGVEVSVARNDKITIQELEVMNPAAMVLSPGPGRPEVSGNMPEIVAAFVGRIPILGVCLGHQMLGQHFGGKVVPAEQLVHGKAARVFHDGKTIFRGVTDPVNAGRYHSLILERESLPDCFEVTAQTESGTVMAIRHRSLPIEGVQFHPESILTPEGPKILENFLAMVGK